MTDSPGAPIIAARSITYGYPGAERPALDHADLEVRSGEYVAILGANGSGKSTLLKLLVGLIVPDFGLLSVCGEADPKEFRRRVSVVLQNPDDQIVATVVEEDVAFGPGNLGLSPQETARRVTAALRAVGLENSRRKPPHFLSGGERQRLALAGALAMEAPVLALDEAASMIDPAGRGAFLDLLDGFAAEGKTILHVTHSMEDASRASRVVVLKRGRKVFDGTPVELFDRPELEDWGLEPPQAIVCARALQRSGLSISPVKLDPEGFAAALAAALPAKTEPQPQMPRTDPAPPARDDAVLRFERVSHTYLSGTSFASTALRRVDLSLDRGRTMALVGSSGSGKSTLLRHGNAVLLPQEGRALVLGSDTLDASVPLRPLRMRAALSVQNPEAALFSRYVADDVAYGPRNKGLSGKPLVAAVRGAMEKAGLPYAEYRDRETPTLSGGEKRKAALAGVFALDAELYLLDEPSAALDPTSRRMLLDRLLRLPKDGASLLATTHSMEEAARFDRVAVMVGGVLAAEGSPREIFYDRYDPSWGLGLPWAVAVSRALSARGIGTPGRALDAEELARNLSGGGVHPEAAEPVPSNERAPPPTASVRRRGMRRGAGVEFFRNAVIGQFMDKPSPIRDLSPAVKYAGLLALLLLSTIGENPSFSLGALAATLLLGAVARIGPRHLLRGALPAVPYLALIVAFQLAFSWPGDASRAFFRLGPLDVTADELRRSFLLIVRFFSLLAELSLFSAVTPLSEAVGGVEKALSPLGRIGFPVRDFSMIAAVALRFVPVLAEEAERIATAQLSRGGGYAGKGRVRAGLALTVPLFLRSLERAEALATAMELRLYGADRS